MKKFRFFLDIDKEEKWLNTMAKQGYIFIGKLVRYHFRPAQTETSTIKIDYRSFKNQVDYQDYRTLFEDSGWKHIAGSKNSGVQYFERIDENASKDIFSDISSKAGRYKRLSEMYLTLALPLTFALILSPVKFSTLLHPMSWYLTPGLWEKAGISFWWSFLFETPFVLLRNLSWVILIPIASFFLIKSMRARMQYRKMRNSTKHS
ncbi:DUF2812 domain-containing protein [Hazenella sp. IB182357]|uniref:DUF2812 domain-containing protein n=1 Tax=Polycladospora coralii TaxID=2771432 RepID=A0A926N869_9BACL|nr:DUF2812 domain-containing protein [Polycladospora coralii]MBS7529347.1 DUF2812 domain-containing protein [Polycladospora coralii]